MKFKGDSGIEIYNGFRTVRDRIYELLPYEDTMMSDDPSHNRLMFEIGVKEVFSILSSVEEKFSAHKEFRNGVESLIEAVEDLLTDVDERYFNKDRIKNFKDAKLSLLDNPTLKDHMRLEIQYMKYYNDRFEMLSIFKDSLEEYLLESLKDNSCPEDQTEAAKNISPNYIFDPSAVLRIHKEFNGRLWKELNEVEFISLFDRSRKSKHKLEFTRYSQNLFGYLLIRMEELYGIRLSPADISLHFGIKNFSKIRNYLKDNPNSKLKEKRAIDKIVGSMRLGTVNILTK